MWTRGRSSSRRRLRCCRATMCRRCTSGSRRWSAGCSRRRHASSWGAGSPSAAGRSTSSTCGPPSRSRQSHEHRETGGRRVKIRRALISVSDRTGLEELAAGLVELNVAIVCSGGTARVLSRAGIAFTPVSEVTGMPEMLDGRLKTLHPRIHGGILADRRKPHHLSQLKEYGIAAIDMVVCNLYPFAETIARPDVSEADAIEQIDIGGPSMVRAAAKNHKWVAVVVNPQKCPEILREMRLRAGGLSDETRARLAAEAFAHTAAYDIAVSRWMGRDDPFPETLLIALERRMALRYGENPHQAGAFYAVGSPSWHQLGGKELSYTNLLDL